jgi:Coenzyme PQQ synthesis protein D (PqqD)
LVTAGPRTRVQPDRIAEPDVPDVPPWGAGAPGPPRPDLLVTELDGDLTIYDPSRDQAHALNGSAGDIWRLIDGEHELDDIVEQIAAAYSSSADEVRPHVVRTIDYFVDQELIRVAGGT